MREGDGLYTHLQADGAGLYEARLGLHLSRGPLGHFSADRSTLCGPRMKESGLLYVARIRESLIKHSGLQ